jgi:hypothetical protein
MLMPLVILLAAAAGEAPPTTAATQPTTAVPAAPVDSDKIVCRKITRPGSTFGRTKVCMTKAEWAQKARDDSNGLGLQTTPEPPLVSR